MLLGKAKENIWPVAGHHNASSHFRSKILSRFIFIIKSCEIHCKNSCCLVLNHWGVAVIAVLQFWQTSWAHLYLQSDLISYFHFTFVGYDQKPLRKYHFIPVTRQTCLFFSQTTSIRSRGVKERHKFQLLHYACQIKSWGLTRRAEYNLSKPL